MVVKIPIYVEVDQVLGEDVPKLVEHCNHYFTKELLRSSVADLRITVVHLSKFSVSSAKIISREQALDTLRTKK